MEMGNFRRVTIYPTKVTHSPVGNPSTNIQPENLIISDYKE